MSEKLSPPIVPDRETHVTAEAALLVAKINANAAERPFDPLTYFKDKKESEWLSDTRKGKAARVLGAISNQAQVEQTPLKDRLSEAIRQNPNVHAG